MTSIEVPFFEGTEKLFEIWFDTTGRKKNSNELDLYDLRRISRKEWSELLKYVNCTIISEIASESVTAYLLSESSMFVSSKRFILKTCGQTTLLNALEPLLQIAKEKCHLDLIKDVFYSRRKFLQPHLQERPHQSFDAEINTLNEHFENGAAYALGRFNCDTWYLYTMDTELGVEDPDQTLEIIMSNLDANVMNNFVLDQQNSAQEITKKTGIASLVPGSIMDSKLFDPCGYSLNGLKRVALTDYYYTIHVTPQEECSYVSFETNLPESSYLDMARKVISIFRPGRFVLTVFANKEAPCKPSINEFSSNNIDGYLRQECQISQLRQYTLIYLHYITMENAKKLT